ncbi:MAG: ACT domain-containing protein, partial [Planctomycetota bacterium]|nr:ACT domain-containing protein [Planctomycetota bacterium]
FRLALEGDSRSGILEAASERESRRAGQSGKEGGNMKSSRVVEIELEMKDRPGILAEVAGTLSGAGVNIEAMCGCTCEGTAYIMIVPDKAPKALSVLKKAGLKPKTNKVLLVEMPNRVGALAEAGEKLKKAGISLDYIYATTAGETGRVIMGAKNLAKLARALA